MSDKKWDGKNDFTDDELRFMIDKAHKHGKIIDVHCRRPRTTGCAGCSASTSTRSSTRSTATQIIDWDIIEGYVKKGVIVDTLLHRDGSSGPQRAADPHRFNETLYTMSMDPSEYRILMRVSRQDAEEQEEPGPAGAPVYDPLSPPDAPG